MQAIVLFVAVRWEYLLSAALFVIAVYAAVYLVLIDAADWAGLAYLCAHGFFWEADGFAAADECRTRMSGYQRAEGLDGEDVEAYEHAKNFAPRSTGNSTGNSVNSFYNEESATCN